MNQIWSHWIHLSGRLFRSPISWTYKVHNFPLCSSAHPPPILKDYLPLDLQCFHFKKETGYCPITMICSMLSWCALNQFDWTPCLPVILHLISWCNAFPSYHWLGCPNTKAVFHQMRNFKLNCQTIGAGEPNYIQ